MATTASGRVTSLRVPEHTPVNTTRTPIMKRPVTREEHEFVTAFANLLTHTTAMVAADPGRRSPAGSIAESVGKAYAGFSRGRHEPIQRRAKAALSGSSEQLRELFGPHFARNEEWSEGSLSPELKGLLRDAVRSRLDSQGMQIANDIAGPLTARPGPVATKPKTVVEGGSFGGDAEWVWKKITITQPQILFFRWKTEEAEAAYGRWDLFRKDAGQEVHLGTGVAGSAPLSTFKIDFRDYLPASPPSVPKDYLVRVTPYSSPQVLPSTTEGMGGKKVPGQAIAEPSLPVTITYSAVADGPEHFLPSTDVYTRATCSLGSIRMLQESSEWGNEEFHVRGFLQQTFAQGSNKASNQSSFSAYAELNPDDDVPSQNLTFSKDFVLGYPVTANFPCAFLLVISIMEDDDGGGLAEWEAAMAQVAQTVLGAEVDGIVREYLEEKFKEYVNENMDELIHLGIDVAAYIAGLVTSTTLAVVGMVLMAAGLILAAVIAGLPDDFYGTEVEVLVLPTNAAEYIHSIPGQPVASIGGYRLEAKKMHFLGEATYPVATAWDGALELDVEWEFSGKQQFWGT
jgi:hypothetical protein